MAVIQRNVIPFRAGDVVEANFTRANEQQLDVAGQPTGYAVVSGLQLTLAADDGATPEVETFAFDAAVVLTPSERRTMLTAAWQSLPAARRTAVLDEAWAQFLAENKLVEV